MRQRHAILALTVVCAVLSAAIAGSAELRDGPPYRTLVGGRMIDGTGAEPVDDAVLVISGGRIVAAGPRDTVEIPILSEILDVSGMTVLPGFFNAHVHRGLSSANLEAWAWEGVTTVRDLGSNEHSLTIFRSAFPPEPHRARLVAAGPLITVPGGYPIVPFGGSWNTVVTSINDARETGERLLDGDSDLLKLALETGTMFGQPIPVMSLGEASMLVRVAHGRDTVVSAHITSTVDLDLALDAGVDDLAHMAVDRLLTNAEIQRIVDDGVSWVPTLELWLCTGRRTMAVANLGRFVAGHGMVALGSDFEGYTCSWDLGMPMTEIRLMAEAGMTPMQIIVAATLNAARVSNLEGDLGTLEEGKIADVLVVEGDPLSDLDALRETRLVIHEGTIIRNELPSTTPPPPRPAGGRVGG
jgi:imidazolonepropionase-like amidohydrolase